MASRTSVVPPLRTNPSAASPSGTPTPRQLIVASAAAAALYAGYAAQRRRPLAVPKPWEAALAANTAYAIALSRAATAGAPPGPETHRGVSDFLSTLKARVLNGSGYAAPSLLSNELVVEFTEFVDVPDHNVHDCVEMELPARGEVRVHSYVDRPLRATLRLANNATPSSARTASFRAGEGTVPADNAASRTASMMAPCIPTSRTLCDIVDERYAVASGNQLRFVPGRAETNLIMSYETTTAYDVEPAVVCRECRISPDSTVGQLRLRIQLKVEKPALDVCVQIVLPKRGELRSSPSLSCGTWGRPEGGAPNEFQWLAGDVGVAAGDELSSVTDSLSDVHAKELWCEWVFYIPSNSGADVSFRSARNTPRERRAANGVQELDESITAAVDANPSVSLSYTSKTSASGLKARRITIEERGEDGQWVPWSDSDPERTVTTSASYRTMYSQQLRVLTDD